MKQEFNLSAMVCVSAYTKIKAENREEALEIAERRGVVIDTYGMSVDESWVISNADGEPHDITIDGEE